MKRPFLLLLSIIMSLLQQVRAGETYPLWVNGAPGALGKEDKDIPTLTVFLPPADKATGAAIVVCPGGGYGGLAGHEGKDYALWLNENGIAAFVVKYRLGSGGYKHPRMLEDAARALRTVRTKAEDYKIDPKRIGIMGSSAGGHLASTLLTHFDAGLPDASDPIDQASSRPDFGILCYPVITMGEKTHQGSKSNLLGPNPSAELVELLSNEKQVTSATPPTFVWHTVEDTVVSVDNALMFGAALTKAKVPYAMHIYEKGPHGIGLAGGHLWTKELIFWLGERGILKK
ncbi:MAG: alpha/beta hydrolase [Verrucomicrobiales bacterium]